MAIQRVIQNTKGAVRSLPLSDKLVNLLQAVGDETGVYFEVFSGGQTHERDPKMKGKPGGYTGSHRHDNGNAADLKLYTLDADGKKHYLDQSDPEDMKVWKDVVRLSTAGGATGIGSGEGYMRPNSIHIGYGGRSTWGAGGSSANAPKWLREAVAAGRTTPPLNIPNGPTQAVAAIDNNFPRQRPAALTALGYSAADTGRTLGSFPGSSVTPRLQPNNTLSRISQVTGMSADARGNSGRTALDTGLGAMSDERTSSLLSPARNIGLDPRVNRAPGSLPVAPPRPTRGLESPSVADARAESRGTHAVPGAVRPWQESGPIRVMTVRPDGTPAPEPTTKTIVNPAFTEWQKTYGTGGANATLEDIHDRRESGQVAAQQGTRAPNVPPAPPRYKTVTVEAPTPRGRPITASQAAPQPRQRPMGAEQTTQRSAGAPDMVRLASGKMAKVGTFTDPNNGRSYTVNANGTVTSNRSGFINIGREMNADTVAGGLIRSKMKDALGSTDPGRALGYAAEDARDTAVDAAENVGRSLGSFAQPLTSLGSGISSLFGGGAPAARPIYDARLDRPAGGMSAASPSNDNAISLSGALLRGTGGTRTYRAGGLYTNSRGTFQAIDRGDGFASFIPVGSVVSSGGGNGGGFSSNPSATHWDAASGGWTNN